jgi:hypothetical protein
MVIVRFTRIWSGVSLAESAERAAAFFGGEYLYGFPRNVLQVRREGDREADVAKQRRISVVIWTPLNPTPRDWA